MKDGYTKWLEAQGVQKIFEPTDKLYNEEANSFYLFNSPPEIEDFIKNNNLNLSTDNTSIIYEPRFNKFGLIINEENQKILKTNYNVKISPEITLDDCNKQLELIKKAEENILAFNKIELAKKGYHTKSVDRLDKIAQLLTNKVDDGWYNPAAASAVDLVSSVYYATNYQYLTNNEKKQFETAQQQILKTDKNNNIIGGLKADANYVHYIVSFRNNDIYSKLVKQNAYDLLNGNTLKLPSIHTNFNFSLRARTGDKNSYTQPRFFPDKNGDSEADILTLQAGGGDGRSSMRILRKEPDVNIPGGFRYYYTKVDAGAGLEKYDNDSRTASGIFTTEIKPYYKFDNKGNALPLDKKEIEILDKDTILYKQRMHICLARLIEAERQILSYKRPNPNRETDHGESKDITKNDEKYWTHWNNIITSLRGDYVEERSKITPLQASGNCTVYSTMLTMTELVGDNIGYDMLQSAKTYSNHEALLQLNETKAMIEQKKSELIASQPSALPNTLESEKFISPIELLEAAKTSQIIGFFDPIEWAIRNERSIEGKDPIIWAVENSKLIAGSDPIKYALENELKIANLDPVEWAIIKGKKIEGVNPIKFALETQSNFDNMHTFKYTRKFKLLEPKQLIEQLKEQKIDIFASLLEEYGELKRKNNSSKQEINELEIYYKELIKIINPQATILDKDSDIGKAILSKDSRTIAQMMDTKKLFQDNGTDMQNFSTDALKQNCSLDLVYKMTRIGHMLNLREENRGLLQNFTDGLNIFANKVKDLFNNVVSKNEVSSEADKTVTNNNPNNEPNNQLDGKTKKTAKDILSKSLSGLKELKASVKDLDSSIDKEKITANSKNHERLGKFTERLIKGNNTNSINLTR